MTDQSPDEIERLIAGGETLTVEFKSDREKLSDRALVEALAAMANTDGGVLILGVEDGTGEVTGLHSQHIGHGKPTAMIANRTVPPLHVSVAEVVLEGRPLFVMTVPSVPGVTATSDGLYLRRRLKPDGTPETVPMNPFEIQSRMTRFRLVDPSAQPMDEVPLSAIDPLQRLRIRESIRRNRNADKALLELDDKAFDRALELVRDFNGCEYLTMAGVLFLTSEDVIRHHVPTYEVAFQVLKGTDVRVNEFHRRPIVEEFEAVVQQFKAYVEEEEVMRGAYRMSAPNFDITCFREALTNAFVHRDYAQLGTVIVKLDEAGLAISSPGGLVSGVTPQNILSVAPRSRNSLLADVAKRIGLAERTGRGVDRIFEGVLRYGRQKPEYDFGEFDVVLRIVREKADFKFLDFVNEYEKTTGAEAKVDLLLVTATLARCRAMTFAQILDLTQRDEKFMREAIAEWIAQGVIRESALEGKYGLSPVVVKKLTGKAIYARQSDAEIEVNRLKIESCLRSEGTIRRSKIISVCQLTEKQANLILKKMLLSGKIIKIGSGSATRYQLADRIVPSA